MSNSQSFNLSTSAIKLIQDIGRLLNNRQGSDVQFKVGGGSTDPTLSSTGETIYDSSSAVTMYAHTVILRCRSRHFAAMLDNDKEWKERSGGVIHKPNVSSSVFYKILDYIYTGDLHVKTDDLFEVMVTAEEMELEELSIKCQTDIIKFLKQTILINNNGEIKETEESNQEHLSVDVAVRRILLPTLIFSHNHTMTDFFQEIFSFTISNIKIILNERDTRIAFFESIPTQIFQQILASEALDLQEYDIWELAFSWACFKTKILKSKVETYFILESGNDHEFYVRTDSSSDVIEEGNNSEDALVSDEQLKQLKAKLTPLLPAIRFSLIDGDQYSRILDVLSYFLPARRIRDLNKFYAQSYEKLTLDVPRRNKKLDTKSLEDDLKIFSKIIDKVESWRQMKTWIVESNGMNDIHSVDDVKLKLLFRASEHAFGAKAFHEHCDNKGPTLVIVKSSEGHLFGGVDFSHWKSGICYSGHASDFIFALADGRHRNVQTKYIYNGDTNKLTAIKILSNYGPIFGNDDFYIVDKADTVESRSDLPRCYKGNKASNTALAGKREFLVADYEVFSIYTR